MKSNKGVTLIELIVVVALILMVIPIYWFYINMSVEDSATLNDKVAVQTSVNALMNQLQRDIQEARNPINPNNIDYIGDAENVIGMGKKGFLICKPSIENKYQSVLYEFDEDKNMVIGTYSLKLNISEGEDIEINQDGSPDIYTSEYNFIDSIYLERVGTTGVKVTIDGKISDKSHYKLSNTYYTRNTVF